MQATQLVDELKGNDPNRTSFSNSNMKLDTAYLNRWTKALKTNTTVTHLCLRVDNLISNHQPSCKEVNNYYEDDEFAEDAYTCAMDEEDYLRVSLRLADLLEYLKDSHAIEELTLCQEFDHPLANSIINMMLRNLVQNDMAQDLTIHCRLQVERSVLADVVERSPVLHSISFPVSSHGIPALVVPFPDTSDDDYLAEALGKCNRLSHLELTYIDKDVKSQRFVDLVLLSLSRRNDTIEHLILSMWEADGPVPLPQQLSTLVQSSGVGVLELQHISSETICDFLTSVLPHHRGRRYRFVKNKVWEQADLCLENLFQSARKSATACQATIDVSFRFASPYNETKLPPKWSYLFDISPHCPFRTSELQFQLSGPDQMAAIVHCLPMAVYLQTLHLEFVSPVGSLVQDGSPLNRSFLQALRQNFSLREFSARYTRKGSNTKGEEVVFTPKTMRKIRAYLDRNQMLPWLLSSLDRKHSDGTTGLLAPSLMALTSATSRLGPTRVLTGLMSLGTEYTCSMVEKRQRPN